MKKEDLNMALREIKKNQEIIINMLNKLIGTIQRLIKTELRMVEGIDGLVTDIKKIKKQ